MSMTRREFLEAAAASSVLAISAGTSGAANAAPAAPKVRRGVAMYSYQEEYFARDMDVEDILREMADIGAYGIEVIPEMMVPGFPEPSESWVDQWHGWMDTYKTFPACYTQFIDTMRTRSHNLTVEEGVETMLRDLRLAKRLGVPNVRALMGTPVPILEATLPHLDDFGIKLGVELHSPMSLKGELTERLLELTEKSEYFGLVPDFGIFQNKPNPYLRDRLIRDGIISAESAAQIEETWLNDGDKQELLVAVAGLKDSAGATGYVNTLYRLDPQDPRDLMPIMSKCIHIHGKTWGLDEDCNDPTMDLDQIFAALIEGGYDGVVGTEYEGQRHVQDVYPLSAVEMVRRQHVAMRRLLGETQAT